MNERRLKKEAIKLAAIQSYIQQNIKKLNQETSADFTWFNQKPSLVNNTRISPRVPANVDWTEKLVVNSALTMGFYNGEYPGLKLANAFAKTPIDKPIQFMGLPIPAIEGNDRAQKFLDQFMVNNSTLFKSIHKESHVNGTCWVWPWFNSETMSVVIEFIPDDSIKQIIKDINTGEIVELWTDEQIQIAYGEDKTTTAHRKRIFTKDKVTINWISKGAISSKLQDVEYINPTKMLPIPFANNKNQGEARGRSDYLAIFPDCKSYHDVHLKLSQILSKFNIKLVQALRDGEASVSQWMTNNAITDLADLDIYERDLFLNVGEFEKTEYIFPAGAFEVYIKVLSLIYWKIVQGSEVDEIFWGLNAQGNHASVEDSRGNLVKKVNSKREQHTESYKLFFTAILKLYGIVTISNISEQVSVEWNKLDALDDKVKAEIFKLWADGIGTLIQRAAITKKQLFELWTEMYPQATAEDYNEFVMGIGDMARHYAFTNADFEMIADMEGAGEEATDLALVDRA